MIILLRILVPATPVLSTAAVPFGNQESSTLTASAIFALQALARGGIYRDAMARLLQCGPDQWEIHGCELSGEDYYFNAITRISRWTKPVELDFDIVPDARARLVRGRLGEIAKAAEENYGQLGFPDDIETVETSQEPYDARRPPPSKHLH